MPRHAMRAKQFSCFFPPSQQRQAPPPAAAFRQQPAEWREVPEGRRAASLSSAVTVCPSAPCCQSRQARPGQPASQPACQAEAASQPQLPAFSCSVCLSSLQASPGFSPSPSRQRSFRPACFHVITVITPSSPAPPRRRRAPPGWRSAPPPSLQVPLQPSPAPVAAPAQQRQAASEPAFPLPHCFCQPLSVIAVSSQSQVTD